MTATHPPPIARLRFRHPKVVHALRVAVGVIAVELVADGIPVAVTCRVLTLAPACPNYRRLANPITAAEIVEAYRANALRHAHG